MIAMMIRIGVLALVTAATLSVTAPNPSSAQTPCYLPDGSMYVGVQRPADCSPIRPKSRDEAIQRDAAVSRPSGITAPIAVQDEVNRRLMKSERARVDPAKAELILKECDAYKYRPSAMNAEQSAVCNRHWQNKATRTLEDADR